MLARFPTAGDLITTGDLASISDQKKKTAGRGTAGPAHQIAFGQGQAIGTSLRI
jgi:hypothetical protein